MKLLLMAFVAQLVGASASWAAEEEENVGIVCRQNIQNDDTQHEIERRTFRKNVLKIEIAPAEIDSKAYQYKLSAVSVGNPGEVSVLSRSYCTFDTSDASKIRIKSIVGNELDLTVDLDAQDDTVENEYASTAKIASKDKKLGQLVQKSYVFDCSKGKVIRRVPGGAVSRASEKTEKPRYASENNKRTPTHGRSKTARKTVSNHSPK